MTTSNLATELANIHELLCAASIENNNKKSNGVNEMNKSDLENALNSPAAKTPAGQIKKEQGEKDGPLFYDIFEREYKNTTPVHSPLTSILSENYKFDHCMWTNTNATWRSATELCKTTLDSKNIRIDLQSPADFVMIYKDESQPTNIIPIPVSCKSTLKNTARDITIKNNGIPTFLAFLYKACITVFSRNQDITNITHITSAITSNNNLDDATDLLDSTVEHSLVDMRRIGTHIIDIVDNPSKPYEELLLNMADIYGVSSSDKGWKKKVKKAWKDATKSASDAVKLKPKESLNPNYHLKLKAFRGVKNKIIDLFNSFGWGLNKHSLGYYVCSVVNPEIIENFFKFMLDVREMEYYKLFSNGDADPHITCINKETLGNYIADGTSVYGYLIPIGIGGTFLLYCGGDKTLSVRVKSAGGGIGDALKLDIKSIPSTICEEIISGNVSITDVGDEDDEDGGGTALSAPSTSVPSTSAPASSSSFPPTTAADFADTVLADASPDVSVPSIDFVQLKDKKSLVKVTRGVNGGVVGTISKITDKKLVILVRYRAGAYHEDVTSLNDKVYANKNIVEEFHEESRNDNISGKNMSGGDKDDNDTRKDYVIDFYKEPLKRILEEKSIDFYRDDNDYENYIELLETLTNSYFYSIEQAPQCTYEFFQQDDNKNHPVFLIQYLIDFSTPNNVSNTNNDSTFIRALRWYCRHVLPGSWATISNDISNNKNIITYKKKFIGLREELCNNYYELWNNYFSDKENPWDVYSAATDSASAAAEGGKKTRRKHKRNHKKSRRKPRKKVSPGRWLRKPKRYSRNKKLKLRKRKTTRRKKEN